MSPARPPLPLAEALNALARRDEANPESSLLGPDYRILREAAAVLDALYEALERANAHLWRPAAAPVQEIVNAALARARQAAP